MKGSRLMTEARVDIEKVQELLSQMARAGVPWADEPVEYKEPPVEKLARDVGREQFENVISKLAADEFRDLVSYELFGPDRVFGPDRAADEGDVSTAAGAVWRAQARFMKAVKAA